MSPSKTLQKRTSADHLMEVLSGFDAGDIEKDHFSTEACSESFEKAEA
jgi:hypothetical protein